MKFKNRFSFEVIFEIAFMVVFKFARYENGSRINLNDAGFQVTNWLSGCPLYFVDANPHHPLIALERPRSFESKNAN